MSNWSVCFNLQPFKKLLKPPFSPQDNFSSFFDKEKYETQVTLILQQPYIFCYCRVSLSYLSISECIPNTNKHLKVYNSATCSENKAVVSIPNEECWEIFKSSNPWHSCVRFMWGIGMRQPFILCSTEALKAVAEFPSTSMYVMSLGSIFYMVLSLKSDVVDSMHEVTL